MPRRRVELAVGEYYHVYNRGVNRERIFFDKENYAYFLRKFREYVTHPTSPKGGVRHAAVVLAYCLMPNHYHFLLQVASAEFSTAMQLLGQSYAQAINRRLDRTGPLFESRFQAVHVDRESYLLHLSRYIHLNPVAAGLVTAPEAWEYSSYREYVGLREGTLPKSSDILREFGEPSRYRQFVEGGIGRDDAVIRHLVLD
ncbi:MAG: transposase [Planctomycetaceae bacterium]